MDSLEIRTALPRDLRAVARLVGNLNAIPEHRCLMCPETPEEVLTDMAGYGERPHEHFVLALRDGNPVGAVSCEWSVPQARGWLLGPFTPASEWEAAASVLLTRLLERVPSAVKRLDTYTDVANRRAYDLYLAHGFREFRRAQVYSAAAGDTGPLDGPPGPCLESRHEARFLELHRIAFPEAPDPGPDLLQSRSDTRVIFAAVREEVLVGYLACRLREAPVEGYVDYLAVAEEARGKGVGSGLLRHALAWCFREHGMPRVSLVVYESNRAARGIYERAGFRLLYTGVATRRDA